jgi:AAA family ATPase
VDLKYITSSQVLETVYEGESRRFSVASVSRQSTTADSITSLSDEFQHISTHASPRLWKVGWDSIVLILEDPIHYKTSADDKVISVLTLREAC